MCCVPAVVIGRVVEGMPVVKRMEVCGTRSGKPTKKVVIADCGQVGAPWCPDAGQALVCWLGT
jgi:hypothetical protein